MPATSLGKPANFTGPRAGPASQIGPGTASFVKAARFRAPRRGTRIRVLARTRAAPPWTPVTPILSPELPGAPSELRARVTAAFHRDEAEHLAELLDQARLPADEQAKVQATAVALVGRTRIRAADPGMVEAFMRQYDLSSEEGVLLMCVAEALLRIPDRATADKLIRDKLGDADWDRHMGQSSSVLVNASTWGLMLTGKLVDVDEEAKTDLPGRVDLLNLANKLGLEPKEVPECMLYKVGDRVEQGQPVARVGATGRARRHLSRAPSARRRSRSRSRSAPSPDAASRQAGRECPRPWLRPLSRIWPWLICCQ